MDKKNAYEIIARAFQGRINCIKTDNDEWYDNHTAKIEEMIENEFPSGSGFDSGTTFDYDKSTPEKLVFHTAYHHMNENGMYDGWTEHTVTVTPSFALGYNVKITGRNKNNIIEYINECF